MHQRVDADVAQRVQVQLLDVVRVGLQYYLKLVVMLQAVRVLAVAAVSRAAAGLYVGGVPGFRANGAQEGSCVEGAGTHFHVVGLQNHTTPLCPVALQGKDQSLKGVDGWIGLSHVFHQVGL